MAMINLHLNLLLSSVVESRETHSGCFLRHFPSHPKCTWGHWHFSEPGASGRLRSRHRDGEAGPPQEEQPWWSCCPGPGSPRGLVGSVAELGERGHGLEHAETCQKSRLSRPGAPCGPAQRWGAGPQLRPTYRGTLRAQSSPHRKCSPIGSEARDLRQVFGSPVALGFISVSFSLFPRC